MANYRDYDGAGQPVKGKFALAFEEELAELAKEESYQELGWLKEPMNKLHNGYFAQDKKGVLKDTQGRYPGRRRGLQPDHEGEGASAVAG